MTTYYNPYYYPNYQPPEISYFSGENVNGWLYELECFFYRYQTTVEQKLAIATSYLAGDALEWYRQWCWDMRLSWRIGTWDDFAADLRCRFWSEPLTRPSMILESMSKTCDGIIKLLTEMKNENSVYMSNLSKLKSQVSSISTSGSSVDKMEESDLDCGVPVADVVSTDDANFESAPVAILEDLGNPKSGEMNSEVVAQCLNLELHKKVLFKTVVVNFLSVVEAKIGERTKTLWVGAPFCTLSNIVTSCSQAVCENVRLNFPYYFSIPWNSIVGHYCLCGFERMKGEHLTLDKPPPLPPDIILIRPLWRCGKVKGWKNMTICLDFDEGFFKQNLAREDYVCFIEDAVLMQGYEIQRGTDGLCMRYYVWTSSDQDQGCHISEYFPKEIKSGPNSSRLLTKFLGGKMHPAGLGVCRFLKESTAVFLTCGFEKRNYENILMFKLGGDTYNILVLVVDDGVFEALFISSDTHLGSNDFYKKIVDLVATVFEQYEGVTMSKDNEVDQCSTEIADKVHMELSSLSKINSSLPFCTSTINGPTNMETTLTRAKFEELGQYLLDRLWKVVETSMKDSLAYTVKEKSALGGTLIKFCKWKSAMPLYPIAFVYLVVRIRLDKADRLELIDRSIESAYLNISRYGGILFEVIFVGRRVLDYKPQRDATLPFLIYIQKILRRKSYFVENLKNVMQMVFQSLKMLEDNGKEKLPVFSALNCSQKLSFGTNFFQECLIDDSVYDFIVIFDLEKIKDRLIFFSPTERSPKGFYEHLTMGGLVPLVKCNQKITFEVKLKSLIKKHSIFIHYSISLKIEKTTEKVAIRVGNAAFSKSLSNDWEGHIAVKHFSVERYFEFKAIIFVLAETFFEQFDTKTKPNNIDIYVHRVLIMHNREELISECLDLATGSVNSEEMSPNVSLEMLKHNKIHKNLYVVDVSGEYDVGQLKKYQRNNFVSATEEEKTKKKIKVSYEWSLLKHNNILLRELEKVIKEEYVSVEHYCVLGRDEFKIILLDAKKKGYGVFVMGSDPKSFGKLELDDTMQIMDGLLDEEVVGLVISVRINKFLIFSLPRPPEVADLEDKVNFKEGGMLRAQISQV